MDDQTHHSDRVHDVMQEMFDMDSVEYKEIADDMLADFTFNEKREIQVMLELVYHAQSRKRTHPEDYGSKCADLGEYMAEHFLGTLESVAEYNVAARYQSAQDKEDMRGDYLYEQAKDRRMLGEDS